MWSFGCPTRVPRGRTAGGGHDKGDDENERQGGIIEPTVGRGPFGPRRPGTFSPALRSVPLQS